ncbi:hypothetical protein HYX10_05665 [Candidatus Woesearchaeota archaeon]|nr:hypothetical protein [Candidatus Woesearchaeota archaeon]
MSFKGRQVRVVLIGRAKEMHLELTSNSFLKKNERSLLNAVKQKIEFLKNDPQYGIHIPRNLIPKEYITIYYVNNLWKANLAGGWRMIYTVRGGAADIEVLIMDILDHPSYDKKFGYRKR